MDYEDADVLSTLPCKEMYKYYEKAEKFGLKTENHANGTFSTTVDPWSWDELRKAQLKDDKDIKLTLEKKLNSANDTLWQDIAANNNSNKIMCDFLHFKNRVLYR